MAYISGKAGRGLQTPHFLENRFFFSPTCSVLTDTGTRKMQSGFKNSVRTLKDAFFSFLKNAGVLAVNAKHKLHDFSKSQMNCQKLVEKKKSLEF